MLKDVDVLRVDMQDVGLPHLYLRLHDGKRMRAAKTIWKDGGCCDRPNPINGVSVEGNVLEAEQASLLVFSPCHSPWPDHWRTFLNCLMVISALAATWKVKYRWEGWSRVIGWTRRTPLG